MHKWYNPMHAVVLRHSGLTIGKGNNTKHNQEIEWNEKYELITIEMNNRRKCIVIKLKIKSEEKRNWKSKKKFAK